LTEERELQEQEVEAEAEVEVEVPLEAEAPADELAALREELAATQAREAEYLDGWQRARAELANARKRFQREREDIYANARADVWSRLLSIVDDFRRAVGTMPQALADQGWTGGVLLIYRNLQRLLEQDGVTPIEAVGQAFDPFAHQAVTHEPSEDVPEGHIIAELQTGYRLGERVLRPTMVRVSSGPPVEVEAEAEAKAEE
jgi:molecular chaperone GrpE